MKAAKTIVAALLMAGLPLLVRAEPHIAGTSDFELDMVFRTQGKSTLYWGMVLAGVGSIICWHLAVMLWRRRADDPRRVLATFVANMRLMLDNGTRPVFIREGGSIPVGSLFKKALNVDTLFVGFGLPDDRIHAPNEKMDLDAFHAGARTAAALYEKLSQL